MSNTLTLTHWSDRLHLLAACDDAIAWAVTQESPLAAWRACERADWLLWTAARLGVDRRLVVRAACSCVRLALSRLALSYVPVSDGRPIRAIEAAERWAAGVATIEEVRRAACAADAAYIAYTAPAAAYAADAAAYAAYAAFAPQLAEAVAYSAARAAAADAAADAADYAADAADYAAYSAAVAAASDATYDAMLCQCADIVRSVISEDMMLAAWQDKEDAQ